MKKQMRKIFTLWLPILLMIGSWNGAWGQGQEIVPVENENAGTITYGANVDVSKDARIPIISVEMAVGNVVTNNNSSTNNENTGRPRNDLSNVWDGIVDENSWCEFTPGGNNTSLPDNYKGKVGLAIMFNPFVIDKIEIIRGAQNKECPKEIEIEYGYVDNGGNGGKQYGSYKFTSLSENSSTEGKSMLIDLKSPINLNSTEENPVNTVVILFTPSEDLGSSNFALDEIILHGYFDVKVTHKPTKWRALHNDVTGDSFDDCEWFTSTNSSVQGDLQMQPAHHYTDTIYMKKGETRTLVLPDRNTNATEYANINNKSYQRWYDYKTDGLLGALRPKKADENNLIPIRNGFLALPYQQINGNQNTPTPYQIDFTYPEDGEDSYIIACDVSNYIDVNLDLEQPNEDGERTLQEPTLTHRILYYIKAVDDEETMEKDFYHEKYDISFPFTRLSDHTLDLVALSKDADAYAFPGTDDGSLSIEVTNNTAGIKLQAQKVADTWFNVTNDGKNATISGNHRTISFAYPNTDNTYGTQSVNTPQDGSEPKATIKVTKTINSTTYNIATYNLTFKRNTVLLTQSIIDQLEKDDEGEEGETGTTPAPWDNYKFRTPKALTDNYKMPLRELNWDYDKVTIGQGTNYSPHYYPYPMDWSYSTYGFFDGTQSENMIASIREHPYPEWGHYAITDGYIESTNNGQEWAWPTTNTSPAPSKQLKNSAGKVSTFHLYVDASDRPGTIARLAFPGDLCAGSEIIVSAWVKSAASWNKDGSNDDASVLFTIMGVDADDTRTPLYRHCTGQIRNTLYMNTSIPGCGEGNNEWLQVYFSFVNEAGPNEYKEYLLQIDNYSASSNGADIYFDDIRCYIAKPQPRVTQQKLTCGERTRVRMDLNWAELISRVGDTELTGNESNTENGIDFCFIDIEEYQKALSPDKGNIAKALEKAAVSIGREGGDYDRKYGSLYYDLNYEKNKAYDDSPFDVTDDESGALADKNTGEGGDLGKRFFYRDEAEGDDYYENGEKLLSVDFFVDMSQGRDYWILIRDHNDDIDGDASIFSLFGDPELDCAIKAEFRVEGQNLIRMNGEIANNRDGYCTGQIFEFSVNMRYLSDDGTYVDYTNDDIMYDWFFGTEAEFNGTDENTKQDEVSLREALRALRTSEDGGINDTGACSEWDDTEQKWKLHLTGDATLDSKYVEVIEKYLNEKPTTDDRLQAKLVLLKKTLEIRILEHGLDLVVAPIDTRDKTSEEAKNITLCFEPIYLPLKASGKAPQVQPGFEYMDYGEYGDGYNPAMRIGLQQIKDANKYNEGKWITVNLRNARFALNNDEYKGQVPDHIGLRYEAESGEDAPDEGNAPIYLTNSNDPNLNAILHPTDGSEFDRKRYIIGTVKYLTATPNTDGVLSDDPDENTMVIYFHYGESMDENDTNSPKFEPREGYEYTFTIEIEEHTEDHVSIDGACQGILNLTMKVVPEFLVWQGNEIGKNWNNDANWKRADKERLLKGESDTYLTNEDNATDNGYVPMLFSKAIIPEEHIVELYEAGFKGNETQYKNMVWETTIGDLTYMEHPAIVGEDDNKHPIQYDMMVYTDPIKGSMSTKPYRPNLVDQIHFEPGAEMLHAELLTYNKAWVDYKLASEQWYTLASPLQGVVAGDFYTDKSGTEGSEYFQPINFNPTENSRIKPSVYQRAWKDAKATMVGVGEGDDGERAIAGNWSAVYNKVDEAYTPGTGFSVKVLDTDGNAIFRLPKADKTYKYYQVNSDGTVSESSTIQEVTISDTDRSALLKSDELKGDVTSFTAPLIANGSGYYLVGNPFMAHLNPEKFFDENDAFDRTYRLVTGDNQEVGVADITTGTGLIAPLQSFFVKLGEGKTAPQTVTFTADMQVLGGTSTGEGETTGQALMITATNSEGKTSRAAVAYDAMASDDYRAAEDAELFLDSNLGDVPMVYTVAGTMATSINTRTACERVPLGVYGAADEEVTLRFDGTGLFSGVKLYDAKTRAYTPLTDGREVRVRANDYGRYYLTGGLATDNDLIHTGDDIEIYSVRPGEIVVTTVGTPLRAVRVYGVDGDLVTQQTLANQTAYRLNVPRGAIYVVYAEDADGIIRNVKLRVR